MGKDKKFEWNKDNIIAIIGILFFIVLALMVRFSGGNDTNLEGGSVTPSPTPSVNDEKEEVDLSTNYRFTYTIEYGSIKEVLDGKVYSSKAKFSILSSQKEEYGKLGNTYMRLVNGSYQVLDSPLVRSYLPYIDLDSIRKVMSISISSTEEDDVFEYEVSLPDLLDTYTDEDYDMFVEYPVDTLVVSYNKKGHFKKIEIDYSNYFTYLEKTTTTFKVKMEFDDYGKIEDFEI